MKYFVIFHPDKLKSVNDEGTIEKTFENEGKEFIDGFKIVYFLHKTEFLNKIRVLDQDKNEIDFEKEENNNSKFLKQIDIEKDELVKKNKDNKIDISELLLSQEEQKDKFFFISNVHYQLECNQIQFKQGEKMSIISCSKNDDSLISGYVNAMQLLFGVYSGITCSNF